ncbi:MFS transporter [Streptomyces sp. TR06-5]|uniref:MFS transporter n=1 Tax=unclassified Streptomyces TaxID=2593676 RepID=UPI0039A0ACBA
MPLVGDLRTLLRFPGFRRLLAVRLLSQLADGIFQVALATHVVFSPQNETSAGAIASAMAILLLPYSLLGPFAGVLLDRWRRRQVLLLGNLLRAVMATATAALLLTEAAPWLFYLAALSVTAVNRFILAGLSAALPRVVDEERLVIGNSLSPTAGTVAATAGGGIAFLVRLAVSPGPGADATVVLVGAITYLLAGLTALRMHRDLLGPDTGRTPPRTTAALLSTARGLVAGLRHLARRRAAARALTAMTLMRFCYGGLTVMVLMLARYAWTDPAAPADQGIRWLGAAVAASGLGFLTAAILTPTVVGRLSETAWMTVCAGSAAVLEPVLGLSFAPVPLLLAAFALGTATQGSKIATDTIVQSAVDDAYRGRVFALYDMLFNVAFVAAAGVAALVLPPDGRSTTLVATVAGVYALTAWGLARFRRG